MIYNKYDVVTVPFPFTDSSSVKNRPALVLSTEKYQDTSDHCILCMITSAKHSLWSNDIEITNLKRAGLKTSSKIRFKLFSLPLNLVVKRIGCLNDAESSKVEERMKDVI